MRGFLVLLVFGPGPSGGGQRGTRERRVDRQLFGRYKSTLGVQTCLQSSFVQMAAGGRVAAKPVGTKKGGNAVHFFNNFGPGPCGPGSSVLE